MANTPKPLRKVTKQAFKAEQRDFPNGRKGQPTLAASVADKGKTGKNGGLNPGKAGSFNDLPQDVRKAKMKGVIKNRDSAQKAAGKNSVPSLPKKISNPKKVA
jgi:hypothetical protein